MKKKLFFSVLFIIFANSIGLTNDFSSLNIRFYDCDGLMTDYQGRRVGLEKTHNKVFAEIYNSGYDSVDLEGEVPYKELHIIAPPESLYKIAVLGNTNSIYLVSISLWNQLADVSRYTIKGIIAKGEEQNIELIYSPNPGDNQSVKKDITIPLIQQEIRHAFRFNIIRNNDLKNKLLIQLKAISKANRNNQARDIKKAVGVLVDILKTEKERLENIAASKKPVFPMPERGVTEREKSEVEAWKAYREWERVNIEPIDILLVDSQELLIKESK